MYILVILNTVIACTCRLVIRILHYIGYYYFIRILLLRRFTCIHAWIMHVFLLHGLLFMLHGYSCILITWLYPITDINVIFLLLDMHVVDMRCVELSVTWKLPRGSPLEFHISFSRYYVQWYKDCCLVNLLHVINIINKLAYLYSGIPVISTVTPASDGTCVELSSTE